MFLPRGAPARWRSEADENGGAIFKAASRRNGKFGFVPPINRFYNFFQIKRYFNFIFSQKSRFLKAVFLQENRRYHNNYNDGKQTSKNRHQNKE